MEAGARASDLSIRAVLSRVAQGYRHNWKLLLVVGLIVFTPIGLIGASTSLDHIELEEWDGLRSAFLLTLGIAQASLTLLGAVFYSGVVAAGERARSGGERQSIVEVARHLPYGPLIVADLMLVAVLFLGFLALIVPGLVFITWFALIAPVVELEDCSARHSFRRSRALVRPHFWRVACVMLPLTLLQGVLDALGEGIAEAAFGHSFFGEWAASVLPDLLASPLYALTVLALYFELAAGEGSPSSSPPDESGASA